MRGAGLAALLLAALLAAPAGALDLTGTWVGKFSCTAFDGTRTKFSEKDDVMAITQTGNVLAIDSANQFSGVVIADAVRVELRGEAKLASCNTDNDPSNGGDEIARLKAKIDRAKGKGKLKGISIYMGSGSFGSCKWSYKLTDTTDPAASGCP